MFLSARLALAWPHCDTNGRKDSNRRGRRTGEPEASASGYSRAPGCAGLRLPRNLGIQQEPVFRGTPGSHPGLANGFAYARGSPPESLGYRGPGSCRGSRKELAHRGRRCYGIRARTAGPGPVVTDWRSLRHLSLDFCKMPSQAHVKGNDSAAGIAFHMVKSPFCRLLPRLAREGAEAAA